MITRVLPRPKPGHTLVVLVRVLLLSGGRVGVSLRVAHVGVALLLGLWLWLGVSHLRAPHPDMAHIVSRVLSRGGHHGLRRVVLVHAACV